MSNLQLHFGAMCTPIATQVEQQGYKLKRKHVPKFQRLADAVTLLLIHGIISDSVGRNARKRILHGVCKVVEEQ